MVSLGKRCQWYQQSTKASDETDDTSSTKTIVYCASFTVFFYFYAEKPRRFRYSAQNDSYLQQSYSLEMRDLNKCKISLKAKWHVFNLWVNYSMPSSGYHESDKNGTTKARYHIPCFDDRKLYHQK
jgi:hypothetical protein